MKLKSKKKNINNKNIKINFYYYFLPMIFRVNHFLKRKTGILKMARFNIIHKNKFNFIKEKEIEYTIEYFQTYE